MLPSNWRVNAILSANSKLSLFHGFEAAGQRKHEWWRSKRVMRAGRRSWSNAWWGRRWSRMQRYDSINWGLSCKWPESCNYLPQKGSIMNISPVTHTHAPELFLYIPSHRLQMRLLSHMHYLHGGLYVIVCIFTPLNKTFTHYTYHSITHYFFSCIPPLFPQHAHTLPGTDDDISCGSWLVSRCPGVL